MARSDIHRETAMNRKSLWKLHSWLGLVAAAPLLLIAITGSILVFHDEIDEWLLPEQVLAPDPSAPRLDFDTLLGRLRATLPDHEVMGWGFYRDPERADLVYVVRHGTSDWLKLYVDGSSGALLSRPRPTDSALTDWLLELHYTFLAGHVGVAITGVFALLLCALGITGCIVYRRFWARFLTLRWGRTLRQQLGNLHKRAGIVSAPIFLILGATGAYWNITHVYQDLVEHGFDEQPLVISGPLYNESLSINALMDEARRAIADYRIRYASLPYENGAPIAFYGESPPLNPLRSPFGSVVWFDAQSGARTFVSDIREAGVWRQVEDSFRPLHFGDFGGLPVKLLWSVVGFIPAFLALSGSTVWWQRRRKHTEIKVSEFLKTAGSASRISTTLTP
jgi:uncharacterized iron-regulated membrane protein